MATRTAALGSAVASGEAASHWRTRTVAVGLLMAIGAYFWTVSRYPVLYKKYSQGTHVSVKGAITFGTVLPVAAGMPLGQRVWRTSINWLQANEIGMTFGFFFGAAALMVLATLPRRRTGNAYVNSLLGAAVGMPLGVCANCVAPIGRGLYASGDEHGIDAGGDVQFADAECGGDGDGVCAVSSADCGIEGRDDADDDVCVRADDCAMEGWADYGG